jgi:metallo-beta-lactamase family protein
MQIQFLGAAGEVTGSCYLLKTPHSRVIVDCGLFQGGPGSELKNRRAFPFDPAALDAVVVTHAHLDHTGRLPILMKEGLKCRLYATRPTLPLTDLLLKDAAELQVADISRRNRLRAGRGVAPGPVADPLFSPEDVGRVIGAITTMPLGVEQPVCKGVTAQFIEAGHIIGSGSVVIRVTDGAERKTLVFSGDIGNPGTPILIDPVAPQAPEADAVILESTYGDRDHKPIEQELKELVVILQNAAADGGKVLVPAFAVGRTQTLLYHFTRMYYDGRLPKGMPVYLDTPMGIEATRIYELDPSLYDSDMAGLIGKNEPTLRFPNLHFTRSGDESRSLNGMKGPAVIIAGAGMCNGGRIQHHLAHHLDKPNTHVVIAGFQGAGTLGRRLVEGDKVVWIFGRPVNVVGHIHTLNGFSAHGGQSELVRWGKTVIGVCKKSPRLFLTHGENMQRGVLAGKMRQETGIAATMPMYGDTAEI